VARAGLERDASTVPAYVSIVLADCVTPAGADCNRDETRFGQGVLALCLMVLALVAIVVVARVARRRAERAANDPPPDADEDLRDRPA
jgi:hypothetical protein